VAEDSPNAVLEKSDVVSQALQSEIKGDIDSNSFNIMQSLENYEEDYSRHTLNSSMLKYSRFTQREGFESIAHDMRFRALEVIDEDNQIDVPVDLKVNESDLDPNLLSPKEADEVEAQLNRKEEVSVNID